MPDPQNWYDAAPPVQPLGGPILGPPPKPDKPAIPMGYEPNPAKPGSLRPQEGGPADPNGGDSLDPKTVSFYAQQVLSGAPMPAMGMGKQASIMRQKVMEEVARQAGGQGLTGADLARQITHYKAQSGNISNLEKQLGTVSQAEQTALANGQQFLDRSTELPGQTETPLINSVVQTAQRALPVPGHQTIAAMDAAYNTFVNEYAKVVSGSPSGAGTMSDSARHEAMETIRSSQSLSQKQAAFAQMKADMANRIAASHKVIETSYQALTQKPGYQVPDNLSQFSLPGSPPGRDNTPPPTGPVTPASGGLPPPPGGRELTPAQAADDKAFLATNPTPEQYASFLNKVQGGTGPGDVGAAKARLDAWHKGGGYSGAVGDDPRVAARVEDLKRQQGTDANAAYGRGTANGITLMGAGELAAVGDTFRNGDPYKVNEQAQQTYDDFLQKTHPYASLGGNLTGGAILAPFGGEVNSAWDAGKVGMAYGGPAGFLGSQDGSRIYGGALGTVTSGAFGAGTHATVSALVPYAAPVVNKIMPMARRDPLGMAPDLANAAQAEGVDLIRPMVDPASRGKFGALESQPGSQNVIRGGVDRVKGQIEGRVANLGGDGTALETDAAGERVQSAARQFIQRSKGVADRLYNRARSIAGDTRFVPQNAIDAVEAQVSQLQKNPETNAAEIKFLEGLHSDLATPGGKTVEELRQLRQSIRGTIDQQGLTRTQAEARATNVLDSAQQDVATNLPRGASDAYRRADSFYRERMVHVDDILNRFLGGNVEPGQAKLSGEQAFQRLKTMMAPGGDARRLAGMMRDLEPNERQDVTATIAASLGRRSADEPFSTDLFLSQTNKISPQARRTVFGADGAQSIDNLRLLSQKLKEGVGDFNRSKTANSMWRQMASGVVGRLTGLGGATGLLEGGMAGGASGAATGLLAGAAVKGTQQVRRVLSARAMVNPRVSQWLAKAADVSTPSQAKAAVNSLRLVISREPALAHELLPIHQFLDQRVQQLLAANPQANDQNGQGQ